MTDRSMVQSGAFRPEDVTLLSRVFEMTNAANDTPLERAGRALNVIALFRSGVTDESVLVSCMTEKRVAED